MKINQLANNRSAKIMTVYSKKDSTFSSFVMKKSSSFHVVRRGQDITSNVLHCYVSLDKANEVC